jgi:hypothetical protein
VELRHVLLVVLDVLVDHPEAEHLPRVAPAEDGGGVRELPFGEMLRRQGGVLGFHEIGIGEQGFEAPPALLEGLDVRGYDGDLPGLPLDEHAMVDRQPLVAYGDDVVVALQGVHGLYDRPRLYVRHGDHAVVAFPGEHRAHRACGIREGDEDGVLPALLLRELHCGRLGIRSGDAHVTYPDDGHRSDLPHDLISEAFPG